MADVLDRNFDFATNGTVTAAGLHSLIDNTDIYAGLISTQEEKTTVGTADLLLVADSSSIGSPQIAPNRTTVYNLFEDALTGGTYANAQLSGNLTYGTATGNRTISTGANITNGTISTIIAGTTTSTAAAITNGTITTALIPTLTAGTTTGTAGIFTSGTVATLNSTTGTIATLNSTTGTITNLSTTLAGDFTITQGTGTIGTGVVTAAKMANPQYTGFRNRIINGDMRIWQRGTTYALTNSPAYGSVDRFGFWQDTSGSGIANQHTASVPSGFQYAVKLGRNNSATNTQAISMRQAIETANSFDLAGQSVTFSFYAKAGANFSSTSNTLNVVVASGTSADQSMAAMGTWPGYATLVLSSCTLTTSYQRFTFTGTVSSSALQLGVWIYFTPTGTAGADDNLYITGVQLEAGSTATDFERRPIGTELALCQRYYIDFNDTYAGINSSSGSVTGFRYVLPLPTTMRAGPTVTFSEVTSDFTAYNLGGSGNDKRINIEVGASARADFRPQVNVKAEAEL